MIDFARSCGGERVPPACSTRVVGQTGPRQSCYRLNGDGIATDCKRSAARAPGSPARLANDAEPLARHLLHAAKLTRHRTRSANPAGAGGRMQQTCWVWPTSSFQPAVSREAPVYPARAPGDLQIVCGGWRRQQTSWCFSPLYTAGVARSVSSRKQAVRRRLRDRFRDRE